MLKTIKILSFDPGFNTAGWNSSVYHTDSGILDVRKFGSIYTSKMAKKDTDEVNQFGLRMISLAYIQKQVSDLIQRETPHIIASEGPFFNRRSPAAFQALVMWLCAVRLVVYQNFRMPVYVCAPMEVKHAVTGKGNCGKQELANAILKNDKVQFRKSKKQISLNEHESDSIGVSVCFFKNYPLIWQAICE